MLQVASMAGGRSAPICQLINLSSKPTHVRETNICWSQTCDATIILTSSWLKTSPPRKPTWFSIPVTSNERYNIKHLLNEKIELLVEAKLQYSTEHTFEMLYWIKNLSCNPHIIILKVCLCNERSRPLRWEAQFPLHNGPKSLIIPETDRPKGRGRGPACSYGPPYRYLPHKL